MTLVPAFEIGVWNAWILMAAELLTFPLFFRVAIGRAPQAESHSVAALPRRDRMLLYSSKIVYIPAFIYSIFLPLKLGTLWFDIGLPLALAGLVGWALVLASWGISPRDKPVTTGLYRYSRHPMYVVSLVFFLGVTIATASWVFLLFTAFLMGASFHYASVEEDACLAAYGEIYREYMNRTPRFLGRPR
ncbi:MAG: isoprenylcysteine carboxylmethyltransferase family protein [Dehalococcoidia bacterium]|nr:isoprenylcysteine carboxylmethyltransferase family protein [Dehalococcoidia bacterium]